MPDEDERDRAPEQTETCHGQDATRTSGGTRSPLPRSLPATVGDYRIVGKLGEGGMGVVFEAEQQNPQRRVAVKVVRGGRFVDEAQLRMFQREADSLARLKHPNIAAIYEAGCTEEGRHFFAMELVRGHTLDGYLREATSPWGRVELLRRLRMFGNLCRAVHYAHQRGVIHRDLKPANVIVVGDDEGKAPEIKILDFGLARITDTDVHAATVATEVGVIKGTLAYMSPEQARGDPGAIEVRSDVYALGVILFELLTGRRPNDLGSLSLVDAVRAICEQPPQPLKAHWQGPGRPGQDLETIVQTALAKDIERRYPSAAELAQDVERYLGSEPIQARPASTIYTLRKFAQRNRVLVGGIVATVLVLAAGVIVSTVLGLRESRQRRAAEAARDDVEAVAGFQSNMLDQIDPEEAGRRLFATMRDRVADAGAFDAAVAGVNATDIARSVLDQNILSPAAGALEEEFGDRPLIEARLRRTIGAAYEGLGLYGDAEPHARAAVEIRAKELGSEHPSTLEAMGQLAAILWNQGRHAQAEETYLRVLDARRRRLGDEHPDTIATAVDLAGLQWIRGKVDDAEGLYLQAIAAQRRVLGPGHEETLGSVNGLAAMYWRQGRYADAERLWVEVLEGARRSLGDEHPDTLRTMTNLGLLYRSTGRMQESERLLVESLELHRRTLGDDDPRTLRTLGNLASLLGATGRPEEALDLTREILEKRLAHLGERHPSTLSAMNGLGVALVSVGEYAEATSVLERLVLLDEQVQPDSQDRALHLHSLAELRIATGEWSAAERALAEAVRRYVAGNNALTGLALYQLAGVVARSGRSDEALDLLRDAVQRGYTSIDRSAAEFESLRGDPAFEAMAN